MRGLCRVLGRLPDLLRCHHLLLPHVGSSRRSSGIFLGLNSHKSFGIYVLTLNLVFVAISFVKNPYH